MLRKNTTYISDRSCLEVTVLNIAHQTHEYIKAKLLIMCGEHMVEKPKYYKLIKENIKHWEIKPGE